MLGKHWKALCYYLTFPLLLLTRLSWPAWGRDFKTQLFNCQAFKNKFVLSKRHVQKEGNASGEEEWQLLAHTDKPKCGWSHWQLGIEFSLFIYSWYACYRPGSVSCTENCGNPEVYKQEERNKSASVGVRSLLSISLALLQAYTTWRAVTWDSSPPPLFPRLGNGQSLLKTKPLGHTALQSTANIYQKGLVRLHTQHISCANE